MKWKAELLAEDGRRLPAEFRTETKDGVTLVFADVRGEEILDENAGIRYTLDPGEEIRWMADWRYSEFWCAPAFGTDPGEVPATPSF